MVNDEERKLVLARLYTMPPDMKLSLGNTEPLSKGDLIALIKNADPIGDKFVEIQLSYLRTISKKYV